MPTAEIGALRIAGILGNTWENMGKTLELEVVSPRWQSLGLFPVPGALKAFANVGYLLLRFPSTESEVSEPRVRFGDLWLPLGITQVIPHPHPSLAGSISFLQELRAF